MTDESRRSFLKMLGAGVAGLVVGAAIGYGVGSAGKGQVKTVTVTRTVGGGGGGAAAATTSMPDKIRVAIVTFLSGPAATYFGQDAANAAKMLIDWINSEGGIGGRVKIEYKIFDEAGGPNKNVELYKRLVRQEKYDFVIGYISSADCKAVAPVANEEGVITILFDCGTYEIFEDPRAHRIKKLEYVFRTAAHLAIDAIGAAVYALLVKPDLKTVAGINQDYAWGRNNWEIFKMTIKKLKPDVEVVAELFPKLFKGNYQDEITELQKAKPDVIFTSFWGGDAINLMKQAAQVGLHKKSLMIFNAGETVLPALGSNVPEGIAIGSRGPHYWEYPGYDKNPLLKKFVEEYERRYGHPPVYPCFHMYQAIYGLKYAIEKAMEVTGKWPDEEEIIRAFEWLAYPTPNGYILVRGVDHQAVEPALFGLTAVENGKPRLKNIKVIPAELAFPPPGVTTVDWINSWTKPLPIV